MKSILIIPLLLLLLSACSSSKPNTIGNGVVDPVEEATLRLSISLAFDSYPVAVEPAYIVSSVLLSKLNDTEMDDAVLINIVDAVVKDKTKELNLKNSDKAAFNLLIIIVKEKIKELINVEKIPESQRVVVIKDLIKIVNEVAKARR